MCLLFYIFVELDFKKGEDNMDVSNWRRLGLFLTGLALIVGAILVILAIFISSAKAADFQSGEMSCTVNYTNIDSGMTHAKVIITNNSNADITGAWYSAIYDSDLSVSIIVCSLNGKIYVPHLLAASGLDWMEPGTTLYRISLQHEDDRPYTVAILPGKTMEIVFKVMNAQGVEKDFESFWVGYNVATKGIFGYKDTELDLRPPRGVSNLKKK